MVNKTIKYNISFNSSISNNVGITISNPLGEPRGLNISKSTSTTFDITTLPEIIYPQKVITSIYNNTVYFGTPEVTITVPGVELVSTARANDADIDDRFGFGVSFSRDGTVLAVGAITEDTAGNSAGKVYLLQWNGTIWEVNSTVIASDAVDADRFGYATALSYFKNILVVGTPYKNSSTGKIYVYDWNGSIWEERNTLVGDFSLDLYGQSCAISGTGSVLVVGSPGSNTAASNAGKVYIYDWNVTTDSWDERGTLVAENPEVHEHFGCSVALSNDGTVLAVGSKGNVDGLTVAGKVYIYDWVSPNWVKRGIVTAADAAEQDAFGEDVSLSTDGATLAVSTTRKDEAGVDTGKVYVYTWNGSSWTEFFTILDASPVSFRKYGQSVDLVGGANRLAVGAPSKDTTEIYAGEVYIYDVT